MTKIIVIVFFSILAINISFAQKYIYSYNTNIFPEKIEREDKGLQNYLFAYFNESNILKKISRKDIYKFW